MWADLLFWCAVGTALLLASLAVGYLLLLACTRGPWLAAPRRGADPHCRVCQGRGYVQERHGLPGMYKELTCDCVEAPGGS